MAGWRENHVKRNQKIAAQSRAFQSARCGAGVPAVGVAGGGIVGVAADGLLLSDWIGE